MKMRDILLLANIDKEFSVTAWFFDYLACAGCNPQRLMELLSIRGFNFHHAEEFLRFYINLEEHSPDVLKFAQTFQEYLPQGNKELMRLHKHPLFVIHRYLYNTIGLIKYFFLDIVEFGLTKVEDDSSIWGDWQGHFVHWKERLEEERVMPLFEIHFNLRVPSSGSCWSVQLHTGGNDQFGFCLELFPFFFFCIAVCIPTLMKKDSVERVTSITVKPDSITTRLFVSLFWDKCNTKYKWWRKFHFNWMDAIFGKVHHQRLDFGRVAIALNFPEAIYQGTAQKFLVIRHRPKAWWVNQQWKIVVDIPDGIPIPNPDDEGALTAKHYGYTLAAHSIKEAVEKLTQEILEYRKQVEEGALSYGR
jgi:hypothetical protein